MRTCHKHRVATTLPQNLPTVMCVSRKGSRPRPGSLQIHPGAQDRPTRGCCNTCCALWLGAKIHPSLHPASRLLRGGARCSPCHACAVGGEELARRIAPLGKDVSGRNVDVLSHQRRRTTVNAIVAVVHAMCTRIVPRSAGELCALVARKLQRHNADNSDTAAKYKKLAGNMRSIADRLKPRTYSRRIAVAHLPLAGMELGTRRLGGAWHNNQLGTTTSWTSRVQAWT